MAHVPEHLPQPDAPEGASPPISGQLHGQEGSRQDTQQGDHGLVLEIVGLVLQPPLAVRAGFACRHFSVQEDKVDRLREAV